MKTNFVYLDFLTTQTEILRVFSIQVNIQILLITQD